MTPIIERDLRNAARAKRLHRRQKVTLRFKIGKGRSDNPAQMPFSAQSAPDIEQVGFHPGSTRFIKTRLDNACRICKRRKIAALIPRASCGPCNGGDHRNIDILPHSTANVPHERCHHRAPPVEIRLQIAIRPCIRRPECFRHIGRIIEIARQIRAHILRNLRLQPGRIDPRSLGPLEAMRTETKSELAIKPAVRAVQGKLVMEPVRIR